MLEDVLSVNHKSAIARLFSKALAAGLGAEGIRKRE